MPRFAAAEGGVDASFTPDETQLLRSLVQEMELLLEADIPASDDVLQRLFPDAYEDDEMAREYRDLVGDDLKDAKRTALRTVRERLGPQGALTSEIPTEEVTSWLSFLTDLRLAIGTRLGVTDESMEQERDPEDPDAAAWSVLHWLGWVQGSLLDALSD